jgi:hypothetical protein
MDKPLGRMPKTHWCELNGAQAPPWERRAAQPQPLPHRSCRRTNCRESGSTTEARTWRVPSRSGCDCG